MHAVQKEARTTTKLRVVFNASAKSDSGVSLNARLLLGPTANASLIDVLLRFRQYKVALPTDVSKMYRAVLLKESQRDLHRFVCREDTNRPLKDYRMTRFTFDVPASVFAAIMAMPQNAMDHELSYPQAAKAALDGFYVDDGLIGADSIAQAIEFHKQLQELFQLGGFELRKWMSSETEVSRTIHTQLLDEQHEIEIKQVSGFTKVLGWNGILEQIPPVQWFLP